MPEAGTGCYEQPAMVSSQAAAVTSAKVQCIYII